MSGASGSGFEEGDDDSEFGEREMLVSGNDEGISE